MSLSFLAYSDTAAAVVRINKQIASCLSPSYTRLRRTVLVVSVTVFVCLFRLRLCAFSSTQTQQRHQSAFAVVKLAAAGANR